MKIFYKPFAIMAALIAARLGHATFRKLWARIDDQEPPTSRTDEASMTKVVGAAALQAATLAGVAAAVDRLTARAFHYLTGIWPGEKRQQPEEPSSEK
jgi:Protein of unknown function (DUF4235)